MKIKTRPSLKIKRRYLMLDAPSYEVVKKELISALGTLGVAKMEMVLVKPVKIKEIVISIERDSLDSVRAAIEISEEPIKILRVSGTLKGLE